MNSLLEITSASKSFGATTVLRDIDLSVEEGDFVSIIGYSGTGKTTLISLLAGLMKPTTGQAMMEGKPITGPGPERGIVFQNYSLLPWLTVEENIHLAVDQVFPEKSAAERKEHVATYIDMVPLAHAATKLPKELSGGMRQRVSVARALAMQPRVLLLDEPLSALDALTRATLQDEISDIWLKTRTTVIWITNDPDEAILLADRVIPLLPNKDGATLGAAMPVPIARPRERREIDQDPVFKKLRHDLVSTLLSARKQQEASSVIRKLAVPDILPEDLTVIDTVKRSARSGPLRRSQLQKEEFKITVP